MVTSRMNASLDCGGERNSCSAPLAFLQKGLAGRTCSSCKPRAGGPQPFPVAPALRGCLYRPAPASKECNSCTDIDVIGCGGLCRCEFALGGERKRRRPAQKAHKALLRRRARRELAAIEDREPPPHPKRELFSCELDRGAVAVSAVGHARNGHAPVGPDASGSSGTAVVPRGPAPRCSS